MTRHLLPDDEKCGRPLKARHVTVDGVSDEYADAHNAEDRSDSFQHGDDPNAQRSDLTACASAQSKGFPFDVELRKRVMICCNTPKGQPVTKGGHEKGGLATAFLPSRSRHFTGRCGAGLSPRNGDVDASRTSAASRGPFYFAWGCFRDFVSGLRGVPPHSASKTRVNALTSVSKTRVNALMRRCAASGTRDR